MRKFFHKPRKCEVCGGSFTPVTRLHVLCSDVCRKEKGRRIGRKWYKANREYHIARVMERRKKKRSSTHMRRFGRAWLCDSSFFLKSYLEI